MSTTKLIRKLEEFFDLSRSGQIKKKHKLAEFIDRLENKKSELNEQMVVQSEVDETSEVYNELEQKHKAVLKLLKRARQNLHELSEEN